MKSRKTDNGYVLRLEKDELLGQSLLDFVREKKIEAAWVQGIGAAQWAELGFYHLDQQFYAWEKFQDLEIASLQGNVSWKGKEPIMHVHGVFSDEKYASVAGHVKELQVGGTCELFVRVLDNMRLIRKHDDHVGLNLLDI